jgi:long-chain acyl-CoA synthetase
LDRREAIAALTAPGAPYELVEVELFGRSCRAFRHAPPTLRDLYAESRSGLPFIVYGDERLTFEEAWARASRIARLLVDGYGVTKGDRVAISMRNYPEWMLAFMATTSIGGIAVAMNAHWQPDEIAYGLKDSGAKVLFADEERLERLARCEEPLPGLSVLSVRTQDLHGIDARRLEDALGSVDPCDMPPVDLAPEDDATILYTSGSTGHPKGAVSCHLNVISALLSWELDIHAAARMRGREVPVPAEQPATLLAVPLFHATGSHAVFLASFRAQRRVVCMYKWDVDEAAELIARERIHSVLTPAAMTGDLVAVAARKNLDLSSLATVGGGGAPRAPAQVRDIRRTFKRAAPNTGWGMTETNAIGTGIAGREYLEHPESSGRCSAVLDLRIVDEDGRPLPAGERGELQVRGTSVIRGYWNRPDANAETFVDGWLRTGDVACLDEDGYLYIVDRIKDLVIRGGENIGCGAVEAALLEHPDVVEASVYGVPDERLGEEVAATVYTGDARPTADDLRAFLAPRLAAFEIPRCIRFSDRPLPRTASGKILKRQLRTEAIADT